MAPTFLLRTVSVSALLAVAILVLGPLSAIAANECPPGTSSGTGRTPCARCDPGTYQPNSGQTSCRKAQSGWFANGPYPDGSGATQQNICQQGSFSATEGQAACTICPAGAYCNGQGQTQYVLCPEGRYAPTPGFGQMCLECPKGQFVNIRGATACCSCCSGFYNDQTSQTHCFNCPNGAFSPIGATSANQCSNRLGGGLSTCAMSGNSCPNGGSVPTGGYRKRDVRRDACPTGHKNCPLYGSAHGRGFLRGYECVNVRGDLESCGGCVANDSPFGQRTTDGGRDCSAIPNIDSVMCTNGTCVIEKCKAGYALSPDGTGCFSSLSVQGVVQGRKVL